MTRSNFLLCCHDCTAQVLLLRGRRFNIVMGQILYRCCKSKAPEAAALTMHPLVGAMGKGINLGNVFERKENDNDTTTAAATTFSFSCNTKIHFTGGWVDPALNLTIVCLSSRHGCRGAIVATAASYIALLSPLLLYVSICS